MLKMLFFYTDDGPSKIQEEFVKNIEILFKGKLEVKRINIGNDKETVKKYGVTEGPTIIIENRGKVANKFVGLTQELFLKRALERSL